MCQSIILYAEKETEKDMSVYWICIEWEIIWQIFDYGIGLNNYIKIETCYVFFIYFRVTYFTEFVIFVPILNINLYDEKLHFSELLVVILCFRQLRMESNIITFTFYRLPYIFSIIFVIFMIFNDGNSKHGKKKALLLALGSKISIFTLKNTWIT